MNMLLLAKELLLILLLANNLIFFIESTKIPTSVIDLNEKFLDVKDKGFWFVMFYAPWCAHCKRLMPTWEHMAHGLVERSPNLRVGKVDVTRFPEISTALKIHAFPTIIFFRNGNQIHYEGERKKDTMLQFAERSAGPIIDTIDNINKFNELKKSAEKDPIFLYVVKIEKSNTETINTKNNEQQYSQFNALSEQLFTQVQFFEIEPKFLAYVNIMNMPSNILVIKDNRHEFFDPQNGQNLSEWIASERWPLLPQITGSNIYSVADTSSKKLVLLLVGVSELIGKINSTTETGRLHSLTKKMSAKAYSIPKLKKNFQFGWTDEISIINNIVIGSMNIPNLIVLNMSTYEYYLSEDSIEQFTLNSFEQFLINIIDGSVKIGGGKDWITTIRRMIYQLLINIYDMFYHQPIMTILLFGVPLAFFSIIAYSVCSADFSIEREDIYPEDEEDDDDEDDDELNSVNNNEEYSEIDEIDDVVGENAIQDENDSEHQKAE